MIIQSVVALSVTMRVEAWVAKGSLSVGVVGGTGYTGVELLRLLLAHDAVQVTTVTSRQQAGRPVADLFANLRGHLALNFVAPQDACLTDCDVVFFATPNGTAMKSTAELLDAGVRVIDLAADFRLRDQQLWEQWYGQDHCAANLLAEAVYGLPEINRQAIASARLVANPGCYPTAVQLGFLPLLEAGIVATDSLIADCKSGVSGAGRQAVVASLFSEVDGNFKAYGVPGHRHLPEIEQGLAAVAGKAVGLTFVPHLVPMRRGILATLYADLLDPAIDLQALFSVRYADEHFVDVLPAGSHPETRTVMGANHCRLAVHHPQGRRRVVVLSVIDNLLKGAAGQAVQNMNIMFGLPETCGLNGIALMP